MTREEALQAIKEKMDYYESDKRLRGAIQTLIPELRESEDERIIKLIRSLLENARNVQSNTSLYKQYDDALAWLEKQKVQKVEIGSEIVAPVGQAICIDPELINPEPKPVQKEQKPLKVGENAYFDPNTDMWFIKKEQKPIKWTDLTWKDIVELEGIINNVHYDFSAGIGQESFGKEVLERFRSTKGIEYLDEAEQKCWQEEEQKEQKPVYGSDFKWTSQDERCRGKLIDILELADIKYPTTKDSRDELWEWLKELPMKFPNKDAFMAGTLDNDDEWSRTEEILGVDGNPTCYKQKPEWSEEDEEMFNTLVDYVEYPSCWNLKCPREKLVAFIKSLPKRFSPQPKQEWSKEDEKIIKTILGVLERDGQVTIYEQRGGTMSGSVSYSNKYEEEIGWLKDISLNHKKFIEAVDKLCSNEWSKEDEAHRDFILESLEDQIRFCKKDAEGAHYTKQIRTAQNWLKFLPKRFNLQPKQEWSEEDKTMINHIIEALPQWANGQITILPSQAEEYAKRLKSLRPQPKRNCKDCAMFLNGECTKPHWKPSKEQMKALIDCTIGNEYDVHALVRLWAELKKLYESTR